MDRGATKLSACDAADTREARRRASKGSHRITLSRNFVVGPCIRIVRAPLISFPRSRISYRRRQSRRRFATYLANNARVYTYTVRRMYAFGSHRCQRRNRLARNWTKPTLESFNRILQILLQLQFVVYTVLILTIRYY